MKLRNREDTLNFGRAWHLDCRLTAELPEDNVVRARFLADAVAGFLAVGMALLTLWLAYANSSIAGTIADWDLSLAANRPEVEELRKVEREITGLTRRIDHAHQLVGTRFLVSELWLQIGRTRPAAAQFDLIEMSSTGVLIRGRLNEASEQASRLLTQYVEQLRADEAIAPHFGEIALTAHHRDNLTNRLNFEVTLRKR